MRPNAQFIYGLGCKTKKSFHATECISIFKLAIVFRRSDVNDKSLVKQPCIFIVKVWPLPPFNAKIYLKDVTTAFLI